MEAITVLEFLKASKINCEEALELLAEGGVSPALFHDDNGHWGIAFDGYQQVPLSDEEQSISVSMFVPKKHWKKSIREALIFALEEDKEEEDE